MKCEHEWRFVQTRYGVMKVCRKCDLTPREVAELEKDLTVLDNL